MSESLDRVRFRLDHLWAPGRMSDYLDGELAARRRGRIERHLRECDECRRMIGDLRGMLEALGRLPARAPELDTFRIATSVRARLGAPPGS